MSKAYAQISITDVTDKGIQSITELYYCSDSDAEPAKPTEHVELSADDEYNKWNLTCPAPTDTYKYYYTCSEIIYTDETRGWSDVVTNSAYTAMEDDIKEAAKTATGYITDIDNDGIKIHAVYNTDDDDISDYAQITSDGISLYQNKNEIAHFSTEGISYDENVPLVIGAEDDDNYLKWEKTDDSMNLTIKGGDIIASKMRTEDANSFIDLANNTMELKDADTFEDATSALIWDGENLKFKGMINILPGDGSNVYTKDELEETIEDVIDDALEDVDFNSDTIYERCQYAKGTATEAPDADSDDWSYDLPELTSTSDYLWIRYVTVTRDADTGEETFEVTEDAHKSNVMSGVYTFMNGLKNGQTTIDGGCISTGTINASFIVIGDTGSTTLSTKLDDVIDDVDESVEKAATSATNAASSASTAATKATSAATSATNAASSASTAATKATSAASSASSAATSASSAATSASSAATSAATVTNYITAGSYGLKVHQTGNGDTNYIQISSSGLKVYTSKTQKLSAGSDGLTYCIDPDVSYYPYFNITTSSASLSGPSPTIHSTSTGQLSLSASSIDADGAMDVSGALCPGSDNKYTLGASKYRWSTVYAKTGSINTSDRRRKKNITPLDEKYINFFDKLEPIHYNDKGEDDGEIHLGFIAQDVEQALKDVGLDEKKHYIVDDGTTDADDNVTGAFYGLCYTEFIPVLVSKIKQLEKRIEELEGNNV